MRHRVAITFARRSERRQRGSFRGVDGRGELPAAIGGAVTWHYRRWL